MCIANFIPIVIALTIYNNMIFLTRKYEKYLYDTKQKNYKIILLPKLGVNFFPVDHSNTKSENKNIKKKNQV